MKGFNFRLNTRVMAENEEEARKEYRKLLHIPDHIPDEFIELVD